MSIHRHPRFEYPEHLRGDVYYENPTSDYADDIPLPDPADEETHRDTDDTATQGRRDTPSPKHCVSVSAVSHGAENAFLTAVLATVRAAPLPAAADAYHVEALRLLVGVCRELQRLAGDRPFFLGCRDAGRLLAIPFQKAASYLRRLCADSVLSRTSKGNRITGKASEYRYLAA
jgi:hypothetical protein